MPLRILILEGFSPARGWSLPWVLVCLSSLSLFTIMLMFTHLDVESKGVAEKFLSAISMKGKFTDDSSLYKVCFQQF